MSAAGDPFRAPSCVLCGDGEFGPWGRVLGEDVCEGCEERAALLLGFSYPCAPAEYAAVELELARFVRRRRMQGGKR